MRRLLAATSRVLENPFAGWPEVPDVVAMADVPSANFLLSVEELPERLSFRPDLRDWLGMLFERQLDQKLEQGALIDAAPDDSLALQDLGSGTEIKAPAAEREEDEHWRIHFHTHPVEIRDGVLYNNEYFSFQDLVHAAGNDAVSLVQGGPDHFHLAVPTRVDPNGPAAIGAPKLIELKYRTFLRWLRELERLDNDHDELVRLLPRHEAALARDLGIGLYAWDGTFFRRVTAEEERPEDRPYRPVEEFTRMELALLQALLGSALGRPVAPDGLLGPGTRAAIAELNTRVFGDPEDTPLTERDLVHLMSRYVTVPALNSFMVHPEPVRGANPWRSRGWRIRWDSAMFGDFVGGAECQAGDWNYIVFDLDTSSANRREVTC